MFTGIQLTHVHSSLQPKRDKFSGLSRREKRRKMAMEEDAQETGAIKAAIRSAKKSQRPAKIGEKQTHLPAKQKSRDKGRKRQKVTAGSKGSSFDKDLGQRSKQASAGASREGVRAKKGDKIGGMGKKGGKRKGK